MLGAEQMLQRIIKRVKYIKAACAEPLNSFINQPIADVTLNQFCSMDDYDVLMAIKQWRHHPDKVLSILCEGVLNRRLLKVKYFADAVPDSLMEEKVHATKSTWRLSDEEVAWLVFTGVASSSTYHFDEEPINILYKDGSVKNISEVDNALINENLRGKVKKQYICYPAI